METTAAGGINKTILELATHLSRLGNNVTVLQPNPFNLACEEIRENFKIIRVGSKFKNYLYGLNYQLGTYIYKYLEYLKPDIVHIHGYQTLLFPEVIFVLKCIKKSRLPILLTPHYDPLNRGTRIGKYCGWMYDLLFGKILLNQPSYIICVSDFEKRNIKYLNKGVDAICVIPHGVDRIDLENNKKKNNCLSILYAGYLLDYKGVQYVIETLHELVHTYKIKNVKLTIIGEGDYKYNLIREADSLEVSDHIMWKPFLPSNSVLMEMKDSDVFVLLSKSEGYGIVVAEALAMGTPSVVTNGTALEEFTKEKGCFGVANPPNPAEVAKLILKIYNDGVEVGPFSHKIRTWAMVAKDYESLYSEEISQLNNNQSIEDKLSL